MKRRNAREIKNRNPWAAKICATGRWWSSQCRKIPKYVLFRFAFKVIKVNRTINRPLRTSTPIIAPAVKVSFGHGKNSLGTSPGCSWTRTGHLGIALLFLLLLPHVFALDPARELKQYNCQTWSRQNGLPANGITAITQARDGYLWLGTSVGLVRFDGIEFKPLDLSSATNLSGSTVTSLSNARNGGIWVGLDHSSFGFCDGRSFSFRGQLGGDMRMNVHSIMESADGTLWFAAAENGAARLTPTGTFEQLTNSGTSTNGGLNALCCYADREGRVWFGSDELYCWQAGKMIKMAVPGLDAAYIFCIAEDRAGQIWCGTSDGLRCLDSNLRPKKIPELEGEEVRALLVDDHGVLWIGTSGRGLGRYQNGTCEFFQRADGLGSDYVNALAEDREGSLWIGTRGGVSQLTDVKFPTYPAAESPRVRDAFAVCASHQGGIWIGSHSGVTYFDPASGARKTYGTETGLPSTYIKRVFEAGNGDLYLVCLIKTLAILSSEKKLLTAYTNSDLLVGMAEDAHGVVVSGGGTLYRAGTNFFQPYAFTNAGPPPMYWIRNLASGRDGVIWVASVNGIFRVKDSAYQQWSVAEGLADPDVETVCEDQDGVVWAGLQSGIARLKDNQIRLISRKDGLFDNNIYSIVPDDRGNLWVDSVGGIFSVSRQSMNDFADGKTARVQCTAYNGMNSVKLVDKTLQQERVACKTSDGRIWFPSANGVVMIDPAHIPTNQVAPEVHIDLVKADGREVARGEAITVPPGRGELEFHFDASTFIAPQKVQFRYRLEGYDSDWVDAGNRRLAFYTNIKPGTYTFQVIAANADGIWNEAGDAVAIELRPHIFQTAWFRLLCGGLVFAALIGIYLWRVRHLHREQQALQKNRDLLETEVQKRTAELASANSSLKVEFVARKRAVEQLAQRTRSLEAEIEERKRMGLELENTHQRLLEVSRQAGMAEVATNILHNVGNVLNSVNVSATLVADNTKKSKVSYLGKVAAMLEEHAADLGAFITTDPKGRQLPGLFEPARRATGPGTGTAINELELLRQNIEHINEIVAMQQNYAKISGVTETVKLVDLVDDALRMNAGALARHGIELVREFSDVPPVTVEKHKVLQILVNLIRNAKHACDESGRTDKKLTLQVCRADGGVQIAVRDNGIGIPPENLPRHFQPRLHHPQAWPRLRPAQRRAGRAGNGRIADGSERWSLSRGGVCS